MAEPGVEAMQMLAGLDTEELDDYDRVLYLQAWAASRNWLDAQLLAAVVAVAGDAGAARTVTASGTRDMSVEEVRLALRESQGQAGARVHTSRELAGLFPATRRLLEAGVIGWAHASAVVAQCLRCTPEQVSLVEARALARAGGQTPRALRMCARRVVLRVRAVEVAQVHAEAVADGGGVTRFE